MPSDRFFIAPYDKESGLDTSVKPWLIPDTAFSLLNNAYVFRGRVRKRFGSRWLGATQLLSRLRVNIGTTDGSGNFSGSTPVDSGAALIVTPAIGQAFSVGSEIFTVNALGTPAVMLDTGSATVKTFNTTTGAVVINGASATTIVYYYPGLPVMGILTYDTNEVNAEMTIAFDTRFAYQFTTTGWQRLSGETTANASIWHGTDSQFYWGQTWFDSSGSNKLFFVTNDKVDEPNFMRYYDGNANAWNNFRPQIDTVPDYVFTALIIVRFKNRLLLFNTWEGPNAGAAVNYQNRCRYSQVGNPLASDSYQKTTGGGAVDATTTEAAITVEFIRDRLIVFFESSTWELVYTGNNVMPFSWQQINTELGAESTNSIIPFDKVAIGVGNVGIHACSGTNVERIDERIPDSVFEIHNENDGVKRVYGIRDYFVEMLYWTFPSSDANSTFPYPNRVLIYNYQKDTWAFNDDSITVFGYMQMPTASDTNNITWDSDTITWDDSVTWSSGSLEALFRMVVGGNQEGYTFIIDADATTNAPALQITDITPGAGNVITLTVINHNFRDNDYIYLQGIVGTGNITLLNNSIFPVMIDPANANAFTLMYSPEFPIIAGTYAGGGVISRVSNIVIKTKEYNFYQAEGRNASVNKVDFLVDRTAVGQLQVDYFVSSSTNSMVSDSTATQAILGSNTLDTFPYPDIPFENNADRLWHPVYFQASGEVVQFQISMTPTQLTTVTTVDTGVFTGPSFVDFQLHAICIYATKTNYRFQ